MDNKQHRSHIVFIFFRFIFWLLTNTVWRRRVIGVENVPAKGGVLIAPNHRSVADPPIIGSAVNRPMFFMAKQELFDVPVFGWFMHRTNSFPVKRGEQDMGAFRKALRFLKDGMPLLIFPEGTRSKDDSFLPARPGLGMFACMAQVPAVPVRIINSDHLLRFRKIKVIFGKPIYPPKEYTKEDYQKFSEQVLEAVKNLA
jgi:1-acyl-sn-glycerol-3-phosphate acyltransferase